MGSDNAQADLYFNGSFLCFPGLDFLRNIDEDLEDDIYSDDDDDDDNFYPNNVAHRPLEPHPRIRQLTEEVVHSTFAIWKVKQESSLYYLFCNMI